MTGLRIIYAHLQIQATFLNQMYCNTSFFTYLCDILIFVVLPTKRSFAMKKLIAVFGVLFLLGGVVGCACHAPEPVSYKGETR